MVKHIKTFAQSLLPLTFDFGGIVVGSLVLWQLGVFKNASWIFAIYPGLLSVRGVIGGLFSGRLSTGLHLGTVHVGFRGNTQTFYVLWHSIITLTLFSSIMFGVTAFIFSLFLHGASFIDFYIIMGAIVSTMSLSLLFISPITVAISALSFRWGLDPDVVVYPVISTIADIIVTACYILIVQLFYQARLLGSGFILFASIIFVGLVSCLIAQNFKEADFIKTLKEASLTLVFVTFIVNITGVFLRRISDIVGSTLETYIVYPALTNTIGDVGSIIGSTATTKLAIGTMKPSLTSIKQHLPEIGTTWIASLIMFTGYSLFSLLASGVNDLYKVLQFTSLLIVTNVIATSLIVLLVYSVAIQTFKNGWDPDNFVNPLESSFADTVTTISLFIALNILIIVV